MPMFDKRGSFGVSYCEPYIYVIGGINYQDKALRKCERYSFERGTWE